MKYSLKRAFVWATAYLALAMLPALVAYLGPVPPRTFWVEVGVGLGFVALGVLAMQFFLTGRFQSIVPSFGLDSMLQIHRQLGLVALVLVLAHPVVLFAAVSSYFEFLDPRVELPRALALWAVIGALLLLVATSLWRLVFRLEYEWWRLVHGALAAFVVFVGVTHTLQVGHYVSEPWIQGFFVLVLGGALGLLLNARLIRPWRMRRRPWRLTAVREERGDAWTLALEPQGHAGMRFRAGQFAWLTLNDTPFTLQQHPYSFSSSSDDAPDRVEFTVKVEGDFSASVRDAKPGRLAFLEGPFGHFLPSPDPRVGCVMIVGGVGVTPCMSMLRTFADREDGRNLNMIYANVALADVIFFEELQRVQERLHFRVTHVLEEPPEGWEGEEGLITRDLLERHLPTDWDAYEYFICGPEAMMNIAETSLLELGIRQRQILSERFNMV